MSWEAPQPQKLTECRESFSAASANLSKFENQKNSATIPSAKKHPISPLPSEQDLISLFNSYSTSNTKILQTVKPFSLEKGQKLEQFCIEKMQYLPIFLLYELASEFNLKKLKELCLQELLEENYEQLNYLRMDFLKLSLQNFYHLMEEYYSHVNSLEIQGLRNNDLKSVISDYCLMANISEEEKKNIQNKFVNNIGVKAGGLAHNGNREVYKSMIETRKGEESVSTPLRPKNSFLALPRTPNCHISSATQLPSVEQTQIGRSLRTIRVVQSNEENLPSEPKESASVIKKQIEDFSEKESKLFSEILEMKKHIEQNESQREIKEGLANIAKSVNEMEKQIESQNEKLQKLKNNALKIGKTPLRNKLDFVLNF